MNYWDILGVAILIAIAIALYWEITHFIEWMEFLKDDPSAFLREQAYDWAWRMFGTDFGWTYSR